VLINNAGMSKESFEEGLAQLSSSSLAETLAVNASGPLLVVQQLLKQVGRGAVRGGQGRGMQRSPEEC
jgi:NAD(P)-dependent dehydrogenase (short-subunit alcohol dehydrogenase family)